jgi:hypothetical protein
MFLISIEWYFLLNSRQTKSKISRQFSVLAATSTFLRKVFRILNVWTQILCTSWLDTGYAIACAALVQSGVTNLLSTLILDTEHADCYVSCFSSRQVFISDNVCFY